LILIEGIPGSGKSTLARRLHDHYAARGLRVSMFTEGDLHPVDFAWCAYMTRKDYDELCDAYPEFSDIHAEN
jgi:tRNA uridine 5-carbamoylmethylation protein Kti12